MCAVIDSRPVENVPAEAILLKIVEKIIVDKRPKNCRQKAILLKIVDKNQIKCRNCHSTDHISGDKNCQKYEEVLEIRKIVSKNQVPWREAKMTYAEIARTGEDRPTTNENSNASENSVPERTCLDINSTMQIQKVLKLLIRTIKILSKPNVNENLKIEEI